MKLGWFCVILGGIVEIFWVSGLKYSTTLIEYCITAIGVLLSFSLMIIATKRLEVSIAYAVFVGIGAAGVALSEILVFGASTNPLQLTLIGLLILSVIGLKLVSKEGDSKDLQTIQEISKDLGIDTLNEVLESLECMDNQDSKNSNIAKTFAASLDSQYTEKSQMHLESITHKDSLNNTQSITQTESRISSYSQDVRESTQGDSLIHKDSKNILESQPQLDSQMSLESPQDSSISPTYQSKELDSKPKENV